MNASGRLITTAAALLAGGLLLAGCAASPGSSQPEPDPDPAPSADDLDVEAAWLDEGRIVAVVTQGSSTCIPVAGDVQADGQTVTIELDEGEADTACTADLVARATLVTLPAGVDPTKDVQLNVTLGSATGDADLDGNPALTGVPGEPTDYRPSAGWFDDNALVLLTWGSSTCPPIVDTVEASGNVGTVGFVTEDRVCTMDMVPRATLIEFSDLAGDVDDSFTLELVGDHLDATVQVLRG